MQPLRDQGVLIVGSGDIVHNLGRLDYLEQATPLDWAQTFENSVINCIAKREHDKLVNYLQFGQSAQLSVPTPEHYLPLLYVLALQEVGEEAEYFLKSIAHGSISMTSFIIR